MCFLRGKLGRVTRTSENTIGCGRASRESSRIPYSTPARAWNSAKSEMSSSIRVILGPTGEAVTREDATPAGPIVSRTRSRSAPPICKKSNGSDFRVRAAPISGLVRKDLERKFIFEWVHALSLLYLVYFAILRRITASYKYSFICFCVMTFFNLAQDLFFIFYEKREIFNFETH